MSPDAPAASAEPVLDLKDVSVRYGKRVALKDVSVRVAGGAVGLLGPNGAGKSSLIKALLGLVPLAKGTARVLGRDVRKRPNELRRHIGYMPERDAAFPYLTGFQSTWYAGRLAGMPDADARRRAHEVLLFAGMEEARYREVATYSTGMRQRIKLAQALVHDPDLVFLDEPTNGLDPQGRTEMLELIKTLKGKGIHVILSSHLLRDVEEVCDSVVVLRQGTVVREAPIEELEHSIEDACRVTVSGHADEFRAACEARGLAVLSEKTNEFELRFDNGNSKGEGSVAVFQAALAAGASVRRLTSVRVSLEDALMDALGEENR